MTTWGLGSLLCPMFQLQGVGGEVRLGAANTAMARQHSDWETRDKTNNVSLT